MATTITPEYVSALTVRGDLMTLINAKAIVEAATPERGEYKGAAEDADDLFRLWAKLDIDVDASRRQERIANGGLTAAFARSYPKAVAL